MQQLGVELDRPIDQSPDDSAHMRIRQGSPRRGILNSILEIHSSPLETVGAQKIPQRPCKFHDEINNL